jgi:hypothetical protein
VSRMSAVQRGTAPLDIIPLNEDHSNIVKFTEQNVAYETVYTRLREVLEPSMNASVHSSSSTFEPSLNDGLETVSRDSKLLIDRTCPHSVHIF